ncbi:MmgE/PrpD family protein [Roseobacteraceae bacterium NS-SX3]
MSGKFTETLAEFAAAPVRPTALAAGMARLSALDWLACGLAGCAEPAARILRGMAQEEGGAPQAQLFGGGAAPARMAALVNGTISHALDYDDTHFAHIGHPSVAVFPAAFAVGAKLDASLPQVLEAALAGMELSIRLGLWLGRSHYQAGFHQTATAGTFGAAAAAGRLMGLGAAPMAQTLGLAATRAAGLKVQFGTMGKPYNAGLAASGGVEAAELAAAGFTANADALEGESGFGATHHGEGNTESALEGLGQDWLFEGISHKSHACCHGLHAALEAARSLDLAAPEIAELRVRTHPRWMSVCNQPAPETGLGAKFSYRTVLAMQALGIDTGRLDSYSERTCADPRLQALRGLIHVEADPDLAETGAAVTLLRKDGQRREARHDLQQKEGLAEREERVQAKAAMLIGADRAKAAWAILQGDAPASAFTALFSK